MHLDDPFYKGKPNTCPVITHGVELVEQVEYPLMEFWVYANAIVFDKKYVFVVFLTHSDR